MLTNLAMALAHLKADDYAHMRHMRITLPRVRERKSAQDVDPALNDESRRLRWDVAVTSETAQSAAFQRQAAAVPELCDRPLLLMIIALAG